MTKKPPTPRQAELLRFLASQPRRPPSIREMRDALATPHHNTVTCMLAILENRGWAKQLSRGQARSWVITPAGTAVLGWAPKVTISERDYGRDGRAWVVDPPGGLHDTAAAAKAWAQRYAAGAEIQWKAVTAAGRREIAAIK